MPTWVQWVSFGLACIGSIFGVWAFILNYQRTAIIKRNEKERLEKKKKAKFSIDRIKEMGSKQMQDKFVISNIGEADARNVEVKFLNTDRGSTEKKEVNPLNENVPSKIVAGQTVKVLMSIYMGNTPPYDVIITWDDDFEAGNKIEFILN